LKKLIYVIPKEKHSEKDIKEILLAHSEVKFVSLVGIDLSGNDTDERIPIGIFLDDISGFSKGAIQTDGSSVVLPGIATLNNAKLDMLADVDCNWYIDYNYENIDPETELPIGTLKIPCTLLHDKIPVDSRSILKRSVESFKTTVLNLFKENPSALSSFDFEYKDIDKLMLTSATELEFWVKTPNDKADIEELSTSQVLKEQYWSKTKGNVRTALEQTLLLMEEYGFEPEMGHKEVGGVKAQIGEAGSLTHIMEQLEIDWKFSDALQCADNELFIRNLVKETFRLNGLDVNFLAKPVHDVAGSGEHTHVGLAVKLKNGKRVNLFNSDNKHFLSTLGYASAMGILKNYEVINPFVSSTNDSLRRLKVGFEAPICIVTSLGHSVDVPSRNRSILLALIRDLESPLATRFELRAPCPHTNTYLALSTLYMGMLDGIVYAIKNNKTEDQLLKELSKAPGDDSDYLEKDRAYRSEEDVFEFYTEDQRAEYFGKAPKTVYENVAFALRVTECSAKDIRKKVPYVLDLVGLSKKHMAFPNEISGGEKQRVSLARAIVNNPTLLIADEPTGNLDPETALGIMDILNDINKAGTTVLMATHAKNIVDSMKKRVLAIEKGVLVRDEQRGRYGYED